jgi:lipoprotein-releasing system permease protein
MQRINKWKADQVGAFEVFVDDFDNIKTSRRRRLSAQDRCLTLKRSSKYSYIFEWLQLFDFKYCHIDSDDISCHN